MVAKGLFKLKELQNCFFLGLVVILAADFCFL